MPVQRVNYRLYETLNLYDFFLLRFSAIGIYQNHIGS